MATSEKAEGGILETIKTIVYALLIAGVFRTLFFQPFWIPSGSMKETLLIGDFLFVNKMAYGYSYASCPNVHIPNWGINIDASKICGFLRGDNTRVFGAEPERGDVIVFRHPTSGADYVKRLIGLPGDKIQVIDGVLIINDKPVELTPDGVFTETFEKQGPEGKEPICANGVVGYGGQCEKVRMIETLPEGRKHAILDTYLKEDTDNTTVFVVPAGQYFFMGDNRDNSTDSRIPQNLRGVGYVPFENLIGRADRIMFSSGGRSMFFFWTWRSDRYFKAIE